jgi:drug/metabolite transporter (DMT)-like permease
MTSSSENIRRGIASGLVAATIWGGMYVVSKVVLEVIPPFTLLSFRLLLGFAALLLWQHRKGGFPKISLREWRAILALGILGYGISLGFQFVGTKLSTASNGAVVTSATPAFVYLFALLILKEKMGRRRFWALLISTMGVLAVLDPRQAALDGELWRGNLVLLGAALTWALYSVLVRKVTQSVPVLTVTLVAFVGGLVVAIPLGLRELTSQVIGPLNPGIIAGVLYLGLVSTAMAALLWNKAFEQLDAGVASLTFFAQPLVGAGLGVVLLGETLNPLFVIGSFLILFGIYLAASEH